MNKQLVIYGVIAVAAVIGLVAFFSGSSTDQTADFSGDGNVQTQTTNNSKDLNVDATGGGAVVEVMQDVKQDITNGAVEAMKGPLEGVESLIK